MFTREEIRYTEGELHLNNYLKSKTEKNLTELPRRKGTIRTVGSDPVNQTVSKLLKSLLSKGYVQKS